MKKEDLRLPDYLNHITQAIERVEIEMPMRDTMARIYWPLLFLAHRTGSLGEILRWGEPFRRDVGSWQLENEPSSRPGPPLASIADLALE